MKLIEVLGENGRPETVARESHESAANGGSPEKMRWEIEDRHFPASGGGSMNADFKEFLIQADSPRIQNARGADPFEYAKPILARPDARFLLQSWIELYRQPFEGITSDGNIRKGLYALQDEGFDVAAAANAGQTFLQALNPREREAVQYPIDAREWRSWYNPEFPMHGFGLRLDYASEIVRLAAEHLMRTTLGAEGYRKTEQCRLANLYLGELYDLRNIMNQWSYHFLLFGAPSETEPWGWSIFGHHLAVNCFMLDGQIVVSPVFLGSEPNVVDQGDVGAFRLFEKEEEAGLALIRSLLPALRERAIVYKKMVDPSMPEGRWHFADERHLGAAFRDNRVIPYEGVCAAEMSGVQKGLLLHLVATILEILPAGPRSMHSRRIQAHFEETYFSWIGGYGNDDPFYFRVQSPVILLEFDHHSGVWLTNADPKKFHSHVVIRTPNGNDYGRELLRLYGQHRQGSEYCITESERQALELPIVEGNKDTGMAPIPVVRAEHG